MSLALPVSPLGVVLGVSLALPVAAVEIDPPDRDNRLHDERDPPQTRPGGFGIDDDELSRVGIRMKYRRFGRTELDMPVFSTGGMRYQQSWDAGATVTAVNQRNLEATIRRAFELGITHVETARGYGTSEAQLGRVVSRLDRDRIIMQTKVGPSADARAFERDVRDSIDLLRLEWIDLFAIHGINTRERLEWSLRPGGCLDVARALRREGKIRHVGFSTHGPTELIVEAIETGRFDYVNLHWYWVFQDNWPAVEAAKRQDMGVFIISPSDKGGRLFAPPKRLVDLCRPLSPMAFNDLFCLAHPEVHTLSLGASRPSDYDEHLKVLDLLDDAARHLEPVLARLDEAFREAWGESWASSWSRGLPRWEETPGEMNLPAILRLYNLARAFDMVDHARERYALLQKGGGHWFPGSPVAPDLLGELEPHLRSSPHAAEIPRVLLDAHALLAKKPKSRLRALAGRVARRVRRRG